jgi:hypothetical protein
MKNFKINGACIKIQSQMKWQKIQITEPQKMLIISHVLGVALYESY